jgi:hypothetical protein
VILELPDRHEDCCLTSVLTTGRSTVIAILTTVLVAATYNSRTSLGFNGTSVGSDFTYCLSSIKDVTA